MVGPWLEPGWGLACFPYGDCLSSSGLLTDQPPTLPCMPPLLTSLLDCRCLEGPDFLADPAACNACFLYSPPPKKNPKTLNPTNLSLEL